MNLHEYIINDVKPLSLSSRVGEAQKIFNELTYSHIPVCKDNQLIGCITETDIHCFDSSLSLEDISYTIELFFSKSKASWLEVLESCGRQASNIIPVLDDQDNYLGYYELTDIISIFNETPFVGEPGGIIIVAKGISDYSFSEISQIVESNDAKLLGAFISTIENDIVQITLKINNTSFNEIIQTFRRYNYNIISAHEEDNYLESLKDRSNYLNKYLNI